MRKPEDIVFPLDSRRCMSKTVTLRPLNPAIFLFVSGQVGSREDGSAEPGLEQEIRRAFDNL